MFDLNVAGGVDLQEFLLRMLSAALRRHAPRRSPDRGFAAAPTQ
jgi:hypothetical protein